MYKVLFSCLLLTMTQLSFAQSRGTNEGVKKACMNYIEGFYEGDTTKLIASLQPSLYKIGFWKEKNSDNYEAQGQMTFEEALAYALGVKEKEKFPAANAPKKVEILNVMEHIACAKITAWWGFDYLLLSKQEGKWMIEQVLWQGPLKQKEGLVPNRQ